MKDETKGIWIGRLLIAPNGLFWDSNKEQARITLIKF